MSNEVTAARLQLSTYNWFSDQSGAFRLATTAESLSLPITKWPLYDGKCKKLSRNSRPFLAITSCLETIQFWPNSLFGGNLSFYILNRCPFNFKVIISNDIAPLTLITTRENDRQHTVFRRTAQSGCDTNLTNLASDHQRCPTQKTILETRSCMSVIVYVWNMTDHRRAKNTYLFRGSRS